MKKPTLSLKIRQSLHFLGWFFAANAVIYLLIGVNYLFNNYAPTKFVIDPGFFGKSLSAVFILTAYPGHFALLAFLVVLPFMGLLFILRSRIIIFPLAILSATLMGFYLLADSIIYYKYHFHAGSLIWTVIQSGAFSQTFALSTMEWLSIAALFFVFLSLEILVAMFIWHKWVKPQKNRYGIALGLYFGLSLWFSYIIYSQLISVDTTNALAKVRIHKVIMQAQLIPLYNQILTIINPEKQEKSQLSNLGFGFFVQLKQKIHPLNYPLHPLICHPEKKPLNLLIIGVDALRPDMLTEKIAPAMTSLAKKSWVFTDNYSGGNSSRPGLFSLFYGLPVNYWASMLKTKQGPVLITQLLKEHYQPGIFGSASLRFPALNKTVFVDIKNLRIRTPGDYSYIRDENITNYFKRFIKNRDTKRPFFSFLFYDEVHNNCGSNAKYPHPFQPATKECLRLTLTKDTNPTPYLNRYKNAVHFDDALIKQVLALVKKKGLMKNTVIVLTSDHGQEFNDNGKGGWGHANNFTHYQLKTPLVIYWPGKQPKVFTHKTSHYDIAGFLLTDLLGCSNPISDYSIGQPLLKSGHRPFLLVGSYMNYGLLYQNKIVTISPDGNYRVSFDNGDVDKDPTVNFKYLQQAWELSQRFYRSTGSP